jgi:XTP/dITP diphosphohydrolase
MATEHDTEPFDVDDVAEGIVDKLVRRHPHVFGAAHADSAEQVEDVWERSKAVEKGRTSALDGIPAGLPALARAEKVLDRLSRHGVPAELPEPSDVGTRLLRDVADARSEGTSAEEALRHALRGWEGAVRRQENGQA